MLLQLFQMWQRDAENFVAIIPGAANFCGAGKVYQDVFMDEHSAFRCGERGKEGSAGE